MKPTQEASDPAIARLAGPLFVVAMLIIFGCLVAQAAAAATCESLAALSLPNTTITGAQPIPAGALTPPGAAPIVMYGNVPSTSLPAFCYVTGVIKPTSDSNIKFEVWLPVSGWNGNFNGNGNADFQGSLTFPREGMAVGLHRGFAVAGTDTGHDYSATPGGSFAFGHPERVVDWGHRAAHLTAVNAKAIIQAYYGRAPRHSYWTGCSDGGREGLMEAQRYPEDYDAIEAVAPVNFWTHLYAARVWDVQATTNDPASYIPNTKLPMITAAALAACDALDGVKDGVIDDPRQCHFDPAVLLCKGADASTCLTAPQIEAVKKIYAGPTNPRTGEKILPGLEPGSESSDPSRATYNGLSWAMVAGGICANQPCTSPTQPGFAAPEGSDFFKYFIYDDPNWDFHRLNFDSDVALADQKMAAIINSTSPDLSAFRARGGKLIIPHGWDDPLADPRNTLNYYESVVRKVAGVEGSQLGSSKYKRARRETDKFFRVFMVPGMGHCALGPGPNNFGQFGVLPGALDPAQNVFAALEDWVEHGKAPETIIATKYTNDNPRQPVLRTRPLCRYPQHAVYKGSGSTDDAANFVCRTSKGAKKASGK
jgi:feruloyl esterase